MAVFQDLSPYSYDKKSRRTDLLNVGWLEAGSEFDTGEPDQALLERIFHLCKSPANQMRGFHQCSLCTQSSFPYVAELGGEKLHLGSAEIRIRSSSGIEYAAPNLIYHYIKDHHYKPPLEFTNAILLTRRL
jgi:hypothetical protein